MTWLKQPPFKNNKELVAEEIEPGRKGPDGCSKRCGPQVLGVR